MSINSETIKREKLRPAQKTAHKCLEILRHLYKTKTLSNKCTTWTNLLLQIIVNLLYYIKKYYDDKN